MIAMLIRNVVEAVLATTVVATAVAGCQPVRGDAGGGAIDDVISAVNISTLPGASLAAGNKGTFKDGTPAFGTSDPPRISNNVVSAAPGTPAKPIFVSEDNRFDKVIVSVQGRDGFYVVDAGLNKIVALDVIDEAAANPQIIV